MRRLLQSQLWIVGVLFVVLLGFLWVAGLSSPPAYAQVDPCPTQGTQIAPTFSLDGDNVTPVPGTKRPAAGCPPTVTAARTSGPTPTYVRIYPGDITKTVTAPLVPRTQRNAVNVQSCSQTYIGSDWALIASSDESGFINAINYANGRPGTAVPYQIYLCGDYTFDGAAGYLPTMSRPVEIYGSPSRITLSPGHPMAVAAPASRLSHVTITNGGNPTIAYGGGLYNAGDLMIADSVFDNNAALFGGGAILNDGTLTLQRVHFLNNKAGGGAAIQNDNQGIVGGECVRFDGNNGYLDPVTGYSGYGMSILAAGNATVHLDRSAFRTRYVTYAGDGKYPQLYNLTSAQFEVWNSYFGFGSAAPFQLASAFVDLNILLEISSNVALFNTSDTDPTLGGVCAFWPPRTAPQVQNPTATPRPALPTNTPRPTLPTTTPSATPTTIPTPFACDVTIVLEKQMNLRFQPIIDRDGLLAVIKGTDVQGAVVNQIDQVYNEVYWPNAGYTMDKLNLVSITAKAYLGSFDWIRQSGVPIEWVSVEIIRSSPSPASVTGYFGIVPGNENDFVFGCNWRALPVPARASFPQVQASQFANVGSIAPIFGTNVPPAVMGFCGLHDGAAAQCSQGSGSTIDIVPHFVEYCIDGRAGPDLGECDTSSGYPVHAPVRGTALVENDESFTLIIGPNPSNPAQTLQINFVHMVVAPGASGTIVSGQNLGTICRQDEKGLSRPCTFQDSNTPVHLAFQPRTRESDGRFTQASSNDVLAILALTNCLFDDWKNVNGNPTQNTSPQFAACS